MKDIYDEYKAKLVEGINTRMGKDYVSTDRPIDDLEVTYANEIGETALSNLQHHYGLDD